MIINKKIPIWYIYRQIRGDVGIVIVFSTVIYLINALLIKIDIPIQIPTFLGTAISLILAFKLNQSYDRWWEARKIWGSIVNDSRTLALQLRNFCKVDQVVKRIIYRHIAWSYALGNHLRKLDSSKDLILYLSEEEIAKVNKHQNIPLTILDLNLNDLKQLRDEGAINDFQHIQIDSTHMRLCASMGQAERIKNTVFPTTYRLYLRFSIYIFLFTLAISISKMNTILEIPLMLAISLPFFLLERSSFHMQDPFENRPTDTAMTAIATTIEINLKQLIQDSDVPKPYPADGFYIM